MSALHLLSEGTLLSGGEKDRRVVAWDCDEDFETVLETQVSLVIQRYDLTR